MWADLLHDLVFTPLFELFCYGTGRLLVRGVSLGRLHVARVEPRSQRRRRRQRWWRLTTRRGDRRYIEAEGAIALGALFWIGVIVAAVYFLGR